MPSFTVQLIRSINAFKPTNDFMILIISFKTSFEKNKINLFPALTAPFPLVFLSNLFISFEAKLVTSPGKFSLVKEIATFVSAFFA